MPPRYLTAAIVVAWLATTAWLLRQEVWPWLRPASSSPYTIDLASEARSQREPIEWDVFWNGSMIGHATTSIQREPKANVYILTTNVNDLGFHYTFEPLLPISVNLDRVLTRKWVTPEGKLMELRGEVSGSVTSHGASIDVSASWSGIVVRGSFQPHWHVHSKWLGKRDLVTDPVHVPDQYSVLSTLEPWARLQNLRPGQRWRVTQFDPLLESLSAVAGLTPNEQTLEAGVLQDTEQLVLEKEAVDCLVIEYRGDDLIARTFVRKTDGQVLRQEVKKSSIDQIFAIQRTPSFARRLSQRSGASKPPPRRAEPQPNPSGGNGP